MKTFFPALQPLANVCDGVRFPIQLASLLLFYIPTVELLGKEILMLEPNYREMLKIAWLLIWRGGCLGFLLGLSIGLIGNIARKLFGLPEPLLSGPLALLLYGGMFFGVYPYLVSMLFEKQFKDFHVSIVRDPEVAASNVVPLRKVA